MEDLGLVEKEIDGIPHFYNSKGQRVTREGILIRETEDTERFDYTEDGVNTSFIGLKIPGTTIVRTKEHARKVVKILEQYPNRIHAWDTETINVDPKTESVVGKGNIICAS